MSDIEQKIIAVLRERGAAGADEDALLEDDAGFRAAMKRLHEAGLVETVGCTWVRLTAKWWATHLREKHDLSAEAAQDIAAEMVGPR